MYKSASETTLKTSSTPTGTDNTDYYSHLRISDMSYIKRQIRDAEDQALRWLEQGHDFILETWQLFQLDLEYNAGMLQFALEALEKAHHLTGHGDNDVEWAYRVLCSTRTEEAAAPAVSIFLRTCPTTETWPGAVWKIPEEIHSRDLLPYYPSLAKKAVISQARGKLYDQWEEEHQAKQAAAEQKAKVDAFSAACLAKRREEDRAALAKFEAEKVFTDVTGRPGMAEVAGMHAHDAVTIQKMSVDDAVQAAITRMNMWTWATPEARAKKAQEEQQLEELEELEEHDPVLERLIAESRAIREAPLSAFAEAEEDEESLPNMDEL